MHSKSYQVAALPQLGIPLTTRIPSLNLDTHYLWYTSSLDGIRISGFDYPLTGFGQAFVPNLHQVRVLRSEYSEEYQREAPVRSHGFPGKDVSSNRPRLDLSYKKTHCADGKAGQLSY